VWLLAAIVTIHSESKANFPMINLVTGEPGFVGGEIVDALLDLGSLKPNEG